MKMKTPSPILLPKLTPPDVSRAVARPRLVALIEKILEKKLALIVAGPGYGKTTLAAQLLPNVRAGRVWISMDQVEQDFPVFMRYLLTGVRQACPHFPQDLEKTIPIHGFAKIHREELLMGLLQHLESILEGHVVLSLDDCHTVPSGSDIWKTIQFLIDHMPPLLHVVLIGRKEPALKLSRHRSLGQVIDIGEAELGFNYEEVRAVANAFLGHDLPEETMQEIVVSTGGWAAPILLHLHTWKGAKRKNAGDRPIPLLTRNHVFQYLEENIFEDQPARVRDFMIRTSVLREIRPDLCDRVFDWEDSKKILEGLCADHLLTFPYGEGPTHYRYHHLLQEFLKARLDRTVGPEERRSMHEAIARTLEKEGNIQGALEHFLAARNMDHISRVLSGMGMKEVIACPLPFLSRVLGELPPDLVHGSGHLLYLQAKLRSLNGGVRMAISGFQAALERFRTDGDGPGITVCLKDLGFHHYLTGDVIRAKDQMEALIGSPHPDPFFPAEVHGYLILFYSILGLVEDADVHYTSAGRVVGDQERPGKGLLSAWLDLCYSNRFQSSGDFQQAALLNEKTLHTFQHLDAGPFLPLANFQAALTSYYLHRAQEGLSYAENGLKSAKEHGIYDHQYAWLLYARGLNRFGTGDLDHARLDAREALRIFHNHDNAWGQASVYQLDSMMHRRAGRHVEAEKTARNGLSILKNLGLIVTEGALVLALAEALLNRNSPEEALSFLDDYRPQIEISAYHRFWSHLLYSRGYAALENPDAALQQMKACLESAEANRFHPWLSKELGLIAQTLAACHARGIKRPSIERLLQQAEPEDLESLRNRLVDPAAPSGHKIHALVDIFPERGIHPLKIRLLGPFQVTIGNREIPSDFWRNAKAARIFKYLALHQDHGAISRDVLLELAWPREDAARSRGRFHVALHFLRRVLEPNLKRGIPSSYILRQDDSYGLRIGEGGNIDCLEFLKHTDQAEREEKTDKKKALERYLQAEYLYKGPLLEEDRYEEWLIEDRERIERKYLFAVSRILDLLQAERRWDACIQYAEKLLTIDKYEEAAYVILMKCHALLGNGSHVIKTFERCRAAIIDDLGLPLQQDTLSLYRNLTGNTTKQKSPSQFSPT
jgi:ATP/maltotriose-dependent transcriptional regulator MalT/DNA-binding SARP family transcriptional activator